MDEFLQKKFDELILENGIHSFQDSLEREQDSAVK